MRAAKIFQTSLGLALWIEKDCVIVSYCEGSPREEFPAREFDQKSKTVSHEGAKPRREEFNCFYFFATPRLRVKHLFLRSQMRFIY